MNASPSPPAATTLLLPLTRGLVILTVPVRATPSQLARLPRERAYALSAARAILATHAVDIREGALLASTVGEVADALQRVAAAEQASAPPAATA